MQGTDMRDRGSAIYPLRLDTGTVGTLPPARTIVDLDRSQDLSIYYLMSILSFPFYNVHYLMSNIDYSMSGTRDTDCNALPRS